MARSPIDRPTQTLTPSNALAINKGRSLRRDVKVVKPSAQESVYLAAQGQSKHLACVADETLQLAVNECHFISTS